MRKILPADPVVPMGIFQPADYSLEIKIHNSDNIIAAYRYFKPLKSLGHT